MDSKCVGETFMKWTGKVALVAVAALVAMAIAANIAMAQNDVEVDVTTDSIDKLDCEEGALVADNPDDLTSLSIEELLEVEVTSVSKRPEKITDTTAAIYVISSEDIKRSGLTSIPDILKLAPGVHSARVDANKWAVGTRGETTVFANKLLVLLDGRSMYSPLFSGTWWDVLDTMIEDIDRIEIIRGPGATLWGANAVNGVINIITKDSAETQGNFASLMLGGLESTTATFRHGGEIQGLGHFRVYAKYKNIDDMKTADVFEPTPGYRAANDAWWQKRGGFRADLQTSETDKVKVIGDIYVGKENQTIERGNPVPPPLAFYNEDTVSVAGNSLLVEATREYSDGSNVKLKAYHDHTERGDIRIDHTLDTFDFELQHHFYPAEKHEMIWGLGYRLLKDNIKDSPTMQWSPPRRTDQLFSAFVQDNIELDKTLRLTVGSKFERNDYSGFEVQPSVRLLHNPHERETYWMAISRAVRTPSRVDVNSIIRADSYPGNGLGRFSYMGIIKADPFFKAEELIAYEIGYRAQPTDNVSVDVTAFANSYDNLRSLERGTFDPNIGLPIQIANNTMQTIYGLEAVANWRMRDNWRVTGSYSWLDIQTGYKNNSTDGWKGYYDKSHPSHMLKLQSRYNVSDKCDFDAMFYYIDDILDLYFIGTGAYTKLDLRLAYRPVENMELSIVAQDLFAPKHREWAAALGEVPTAVTESIYTKLTYEF